MRRKLLLCVSTYHLTAALWSGGQLRAVQEFADDEPGQRAFVDFLRTLKRVPIFIVADSLDEDFRFETLPRAGGRDQVELIQRKLRQAYRTTPYCSATLLNRDSDREDRYLFAALTDPEVLEPWLNLVMARKLPVVGVYLAPLALESLVQSIGMAERNTLVVAQHAAGLRQTFFKNGRFRVSRLTLARPFATAPSAVNYDEEVRNTRGYLDALNITHVNEPVTVLILDQDDSLADLASALTTRSAGLQVVRLNSEQLAKRLGVTAALLHSHRDTLPLQLLGNTRRGINLAPRAVTSGYNRMRAARMLYSASAALVTVSLVWAGINLVRTNALNEDAQNAALMTRGEDARYREITRNFPVTPASAGQLRELAEAAGHVRQAYRPPDLVYQVLGQALDPSATVLIKSLVWRQAPGTSAAQSGPAPFVQSAQVSADLLDYNPDQRVVLAAIDAFVALLGKHPAVASARVIKYPVSSTSTTALTGDTSVRQTEAPQTPSFDFEFTLKSGA